MTDKIFQDAHLRRIRLERARSRGAPDGAVDDGYEFVAPLSAEGHISLDGWKRDRALCFVHRLEKGAIVDRGLLVHRAGGSGGATWAFDYAPGGDADEDAGYRFSAHPFVLGEYVSLRDEDGELHTYKVTSVTPA
jgi:hypothetical protein